MGVLLATCLTLPRATPQLWQANETSREQIPWSFLATVSRVELARMFFFLLIRHPIQKNILLHSVFKELESKQAPHCLYGQG